MFSCEPAASITGAVRRLADTDTGSNYDGSGDGAAVASDGDSYGSRAGGDDVMGYNEDGRESGGDFPPTSERLAAVATPSDVISYTTGSLPVASFIDTDPNYSGLALYSSGKTYLTASSSYTGQIAKIEGTSVSSGRPSRVCHLL